MLGFEDKVAFAAVDHHNNSMSVLLSLIHILLIKMLVPEWQAAVLIGDGVVKTAYEFITVLKLAKVPQT